LAEIVAEELLEPLVLLVPLAALAEAAMGAAFAPVNACPAVIWC
jgi:hypothetical protein